MASHIRSLTPPLSQREREIKVAARKLVLGQVGTDRVHGLQIRPGTWVTDVVGGMGVGHAMEGDDTHGGAVGVGARVASQGVLDE